MCNRYRVTTKGLDCPFSMILVLTAGLNIEIEEKYIRILRQFKKDVRIFVLKVNASEARWKKIEN